MTIIDYIINKKELYSTFIIISIVNAVIIINSDFFRDYVDKKLKLSVHYCIHKLKIFIITFLISFISYLMCFYLFGYTS